MHKQASFKRRRLRPAILAAVSLAALCAACATPADNLTPSWQTTEVATPGAPLDVDAMLRFALIGNPVQGWQDVFRAPAVSPDGRYSALVVREGAPEEGAYYGHLLVFDNVTPTNEPRRLARFRSTGNDQPIADIDWIDNRTLLFSAGEGDGPQIHTVDIVSGRLRRITDSPTRIMRHAVSADRRQLLVAASLPPAPRFAEIEECRERGCLVTSRELHRLDTTRDLFTDAYGHILSRTDIATGATYSTTLERFCFPGFDGQVSPDGRYVIVHCRLGLSFPQWWRGYTGDPGLGQALDFEASDQPFVWDSIANTFTPLTAGPYPSSTGFAKPVWLDATHVILPGFESIEHGATPDDERRKPALIMLNVETRAVTRIATIGPETGASLAWNEAERTLTFVQGRHEATAARAWRREGEVWSEVAPSPASEAGYAAAPLFISQSPNQRPRLMRRDANGDEHVVFDPNPWMDNVRIGRVEPMTLSFDDGQRNWPAHLYFPPDYVEGQRYPLVIQPHGLDEDEFSLTGYVKNYAAQPLASRGIIVIQLQQRIADVVTTPEEFRVMQRGYEAIIDQLSERGIVDRTRVGIVGWSRTGPYMSRLLTHSEYPIAAGAFTLTGEMGWFFYNAYGAHRELELNHGAPPFGDGLGRWLEEAPSFNLNRVRTPLVMFGRPDSPLYIEWRTMLNRDNRPNEWWNMIEPEHDLLKISQRRFMNTMYVDWFDFWLNGHEDPDPAKAEQYARWRELRELQEAALEEPRPPLRRWRSEPIE